MSAFLVTIRQIGSADRTLPWIGPSAGAVGMAAAARFAINGPVGISVKPIKGNS